jgi:hypothetical protein
MAASDADADEAAQAPASDKLRPPGPRPTRLPPMVEPEGHAEEKSEAGAELTDDERALVRAWEAQPGHLLNVQQSNVSRERSTSVTNKA